MNDQLKSKPFDITGKIRDCLVVMSYNIRCACEPDTDEHAWLFRAPYLIDEIRNASPDIIGFEEVKKEQYPLLKENLIGYDSVIVYRDSVPWTEGVPIFYRSDLFECLSTDTFWLSETPEKESSSWGSAFYRIATYVILKSKETGKKFLFVSTHLDNESELARSEGMKVIIAKISDFHLPIILSGDFNSHPNSLAYQEAKAVLNDTFIGFNDANKATFNDYGRNGYDPIRIDYVFVSSSFEVLNAKVIDKVDGIYPSDHFPLCVTLKFKQ